MSISRSPEYRRLLFWLLAFLSFNALAVSANPFLGSEEADRPPASVVRGQANPALISAQLTVRDRIAVALKGLKENPSPKAVGALLLGSFLYGIFHAAGPGHRKTVVFSLFLARRTAPWEPLAVGALSAFLHGAMGLGVLGGLTLLGGAFAGLSDVDSASRYMEGYSFLGLAAIGAALSVRQLLHIVQRKGHGERAERYNGKNIYAVVTLTSLVPCPGTIMILMLAVYLDVAALGLLGVAAMALGMAVVVSVAAYLAYFGRQGLFSRLQQRGAAAEVVSEGLELSAYLFMTLFALYTSWPFLMSLISRA